MSEEHPAITAANLLNKGLDAMLLKQHSSLAALPGSPSVRKTEILWTDGRIVGGVTVNNPEALKAALCRAVDEGWKYIEAKTQNDGR